MVATQERVTSPDTINYVDIIDFCNNFEDGRWGYFRPDYYIRSEITDKSIDDKKQALISYDSDSSDFFIQVKEALVFETNTDGSLNLVSGNTRTRALLLLLAEGKYTIGTGKDAITLTITKDKFYPIPYKVYPRLLTAHELIDYQTSTNDSTEKHNPYDLAIKIAQLKPIYEKEAVETAGKKLSATEAGAIANRQLCLDFKITKQLLSQYLNVMNKGTDTLQQYVKSGKMSLDSANTLVQKLGGDKAKKEEIDRVLVDLLAQAKLLNPNAKDEEVTIYKSIIVNYFKDKQAATTADKTPASGDSGTSGSGGTGTASSGEDTEKAPPISKEQFVKDVSVVVNTVYSIRPEDVTIQQAERIKQLNSAMMDALSSTNELVSTETSLTIYKHLREAYIERFGDIENIANSIGATEKAEFGKFRKQIAKAASPAEKVYKAIYTPEQPATTELPAETEPPTSEDIEITSTDKPDITAETEDLKATGIW